MKSNALFFVLLFACSLNAQDSLELNGPKTGYVREPVTLTLTGLPPLDLSKPLQENLAWRDRFGVKVDASEGAKVEVTPDLSFDFLASTWRLRITVDSDGVGTVFIVAYLSDGDAVGLALHRLEFKRRGPPPNPQLQLHATVNGRPGESPGPTVKVGDPVRYEYQLQNVGNVPLSSVSMLDTCGATLVGPSGDSGSDLIMSVGETWTWSCSVLAAEGKQQCVATAVGSHDEGGEVEAKATTWYDGQDKPAPGKRFVVIVYEAQDQTPAIADLLTDIRIAIDKQGKHQLVIEDKDARQNSGKVPDWLAPYFEKASGLQLPQLFIVTESGDVLHQGKLPDSLADFNKTLAEFGG